MTSAPLVSYRGLLMTPIQKESCRVLLKRDGNFPAYPWRLRAYLAEGAQRIVQVALKRRGTWEEIDIDLLGKVVRAPKEVGN